MDNCIYHSKFEMADQGNKALNMMVSMGYKKGEGLGKEKQGILSPISISSPIGRAGFGMQKDRFINETWDTDKDLIDVKENLEWIESDETYVTNYKTLMRSVKTGPMIKSIENEFNFCDSNILKDVVNFKQDVFDKYSINELSKARTRANPFETIRSAIFMNRAALKMANIDAATDFMFSNIDRDPRHKNYEEPYYFADVCAGPGGFTEYILWKKQWAFKGFGFTLKGEHDFKVDDSTCCSSANFRAYYGSEDDGNIFHPDNICDYTKHIMFETNNKGVHFMMADGGFSVEGNEHLQEIISKQIYICQCLVGLEIVRKHGHFVTKLFDTFTLFSVGMIFLMYQCFDKIAILKPNSSRPANSERYLICSGLKDSPIVHEIRNYFRFIVQDMFKNHRINNENDILEIVSLDVIKSSTTFFEYITMQNNIIAKKQVKSLLKWADFCKNPFLADTRQEDLRSECLKYWMIPDRPRPSVSNLSAEEFVLSSFKDSDFMYANPTVISTNACLEKHFLDPLDWTYIPAHSSKQNSVCNLFAGYEYSTVYKLAKRKWTKVKNLYLSKGTLLYGELVMEKSVECESLNETKVLSLHVIDAFRLGETSLADLPYRERLELIELYCKSVNFESCYDNVIRIRPKPMEKLKVITTNELIQCSDDKYFSLLPTIGLNSTEESFLVNSILFLKIDETKDFKTSYVLRVQMYIEKNENEMDDDDKIRYECLLKYINSKLTK